MNEIIENFIIGWNLRFVIESRIELIWIDELLFQFIKKRQRKKYKGARIR